MKNDKIVAGITQKVIIDDNGAKCDALEQNYSSYFSALGVTLVQIPNNLEDVAGFARTTGMNRVILSGGGDINPALFGGHRLTAIQYSDDRERIESEILSYSIKAGLPVLGICRGAQMINVLFGGKLISLLESTGADHGHAGRKHAVTIIDEEMKKGLGQSAIINSYHNFGFTKGELGKELKPFAIARDGTIEGFRHIHRRICGILWHPERNGLGNEALTKHIIADFLSDK